MKAAAAACCILAVAALAGCALPAPKGGSASGRDAVYNVESRFDGFMIPTSYSGYQMIPESAAVQAACKQALMATAHDHAESFQRKIEPINEQRTRISSGRNGFTGITSCEASRMRMRRSSTRILFVQKRHRRSKRASHSNRSTL